MIALICRNQWTAGGTRQTLYKVANQPSEQQHLSFGRCWIQHPKQETGEGVWEKKTWTKLESTFNIPLLICLPLPAPLPEASSAHPINHVPFLPPWRKAPSDVITWVDLFHSIKNGIRLNNSPELELTAHSCHLLMSIPHNQAQMLKKIKERNGDRKEVYGSYFKMCTVKSYSPVKRK